VRHFDPKLLLTTERAELQSLWKVLHPFNFDSEVNNLLTRFQPGSRSWLFEEFEEWLALTPDHPSHRAMVLYGGPGLGKSTVVAALVAKKAVGVQAPVVAGHWFCKHNDRK
jgi:DNA replication protein DnaC